MKRHPLALDELVLAPFSAFNSEWFLLTAGNFAAGVCNTMTVAWGSLGTMWSKPLAMVVVRPTRRTYELLEQGDSFTLTAFAPERREALQYLGTHSGRDGDKIAAVGLTPIASTQVDAPGFAEAELILECRKSYFNDLEPQNFLLPYIAKNYQKDYHRIYFGEVLAAFGTERYRGA